jgi:hypothetical protein
MTERLRVRETDDDGGRRLVRIVRRDSGAVVTWRRAQMVLLSAQGMDAAAIAKGGIHQRGPRLGRDPQLQRRRLQLPGFEVQGQASAEVHLAAAARDQEDR